VVNETYDVFVSYSRLDSRHAADIDSILRAKGLKSFFDRRNLAPGLPWVRALEQAIGAAKAAIVLIGPRGLGNTQQYERELALVRQTHDPTFPVVPVILPGSSTDRPFDFLQLLTWVDLSQVTKVSDAPLELERLLTAIRGEPVSGEMEREAICPYRGLDAFREEDSAFFFGRGSADDPNSPIGELVRKVREQPFVMVVGRSGSGKSSLVYAGLLPTLRREPDPFWNVLTLRPGRAPLRALAAAFNPRADNEGAAEYATKITNEADKLRSGDPELLSHMIRQELDQAEGKPDRLLLYVDQWEELYAQAPSSSDKERAVQHAADVNRFIDLLLNATQSAPVAVVGTVRADFYDPLIGHPQVRALLPTRQVLLAAMSRSELESTIVEPARKVGLTFDPPGLVQRILDDAGEDEGMLPLLQYALKESWALRKDNAITADSYTRSGGVREAIKVTAERTFEVLSRQDQQAARQLFLRLVTPGEGQEDTRARAAMPSEPGQRRIVDQFAGPRARLLVTGSDRASRPIVEVAHEALIRTWPRLREWVNANREKLRARAAILRAMAEWNENGRIDRFLLDPGVQLERGRDLIEDPDDVPVDDLRDFVARSIKREADRLSAEREAALADQKRIADAERQAKEAAQQRALTEKRSARSSRRFGAAFVILAAALAVATGLMAYYWHGAQLQWQNAHLLKQLARLNYVDLQILTLKSDEKTKAARISQLKRDEAEAKQSGNSHRAEATKDDVINAQRDRNKVLSNIGTLAEDRSHIVKAISEDSARLNSQFDEQQQKRLIEKLHNAFLNPESRLRIALYSVAAIPQNEESLNKELRTSIVNARLPSTFKPPGSNQIWAVAFNPLDPKQAAVGDDHGSVWLWNPIDDPKGKDSKELSVASDVVNGLAFSPDGTKLAAAYRKFGAVMWNLATDKLLCSFGRRSHLELRRRSRAGALELPDRDQLQRVGLAISGYGSTAASNNYYGVAFAPDGKTLAVAGERSVQLWELKPEGCLPKSDPFLLNDAVFGVAFSRTGDLVAAASGDGKITVWNLNQPDKHERKFSNAAMSSVAFSPTDSAVVAASAADGRGYIWNIETDAQTELPEQSGTVGQIAFSPNGKWLVATATDKGEVIVVDPRGGRDKLDQLGGTKNPILFVAFSPDSKFLLTGDLGGVASLWIMDADQGLSGDRDALIKLGAQHVGSLDLTENECKVLREMQIPIFAQEVENFEEEESFICPLSFLGDLPDVDSMGAK
jgi:Tol biopolymer transport system component